MDSYYLTTLVLFFRSQLYLNFEAIREVLSIIDDDEIREGDKRDMIIEVLRNFGLNEISYRQGRFSPSMDKSPTEEQSEKLHEIIYPRQAIQFKVLNGEIGIKIPLN
jgi:hypothetical protein